MSKTIILAGTTYELAPLTLGQIEDLAVAIALPDTDDPQQRVKASFQRASGAIVAALCKSHPDITLEALRDMPITRDEFNRAYDAVLVLSGLVQAEKSTGEAAADASTGSASTGA